MLLCYSSVQICQSTGVDHHIFGYLDQSLKSRSIFTADGCASKLASQSSFVSLHLQPLSTSVVKGPSMVTKHLVAPINSDAPKLCWSNLNPKKHKVWAPSYKYLNLHPSSYTNSTLRHSIGHPPGFTMIGCSALKILGHNWLQQ